MRILIAPNAFKESLTAREAADAMERGVRGVLPDAVILKVPLSDGGPGFLECTAAAYNAAHADCGAPKVVLMKEQISDAVGRPREVQWGLTIDEEVIIESAAAIGLELVPAEQRNPLRTSSFGLGQLIRASFECAMGEEMWVGLGGSATCDGGLGMAQALGYRFLDKHGSEIPSPACGADMARVQRIESPSVPFELHEVLAICDVDNPLLGPTGTARMYAPQKGASPEDVERLEAGLLQYADVVKRELNVSARDLPGAGAAGGLGFALASFLGARLVRGAEWMLDAHKIDNCHRLDSRLRDVDLVLTGEGEFDAQSLHGKAPWAVYQRAKELGVPTHFFAGRITENAANQVSDPLLHLHAITPAEVPGPEALRRASEFLTRATELALRGR